MTTPAGVCAFERLDGEGVWTKGTIREKILPSPPTPSCSVGSSVPHRVQRDAQLPRRVVCCVYVGVFVRCSLSGTAPSKADGFT